MGERSKATIPAWAEDFDADGLNRAAEFEGKQTFDLPELKEQLAVEITGEPKLVEHEKLPQGSAYFMAVKKGDLVGQIVVPRTLRHALAVIAKKRNLAVLAGLRVVITAEIVDLPERGPTKCYRAQTTE